MDYSSNKDFYIDFPAPGIQKAESYDNYMISLGN